MAISIPEQYQSLKTKLETIVKKTTIHYNLIVSNYNPTIDSTVTLTVIVTDSNGDALEGVDATVTASNGIFLQLDGTNIISASSVTGTTDSNGQFTLTYLCSEWGLITFTADNKTTQVKVGGFKTTTPHQYYTIYEYEDRVGLKIHINTSIKFTNAIRPVNDSVIPHRLAPRYPIMIVCANGINSSQNTAIGVSESNDLEHTQIICKSLSGSDIYAQAYAYLEWDKKY